MVAKIKKYKFQLTFLLVLLFIILLTYKDYGIAWDEVSYLNTGKYFGALLFKKLTLPRQNLATDFQPTDIHLKGHGVLFDFLTVTTMSFFNNLSFEIYHLVKALIAIPIFIMLGWIIGMIINPMIGLLTTILLLLFPKFYGDIFQNSIDVPTMLAFTAVVVFYIDILRNNRQSLRRQIVLGGLLALAISQRVILGYLMLLIYYFNFMRDFYLKKSFSKFFVNSLTISLATIFFLPIVHPYLLRHPITGLVEMMLTAGNYSWFAAVLFDGQSISASQLPWYYLPKSILITTPLATIGLFLIGFVYLIYLFFNKKEKSSKRLIYLFILSALILPLVFVFISQPVLYDGWRHFLFLTTLIIMIAAFGLKYIFDLKNKIIKFFAILLIVLNLLATAREMMVLHPYQYIYYNELVGGLKGAYQHYETDYWGAAYKETVEWFNKNINEKNKIYKIVSEGDPVSSSYYFKKNMIWTDYSRAEYMFSFTRWDLQNKVPGKILHTVSREGIPLIYIKKIK